MKNNELFNDFLQSLKSHELSLVKEMHTYLLKSGHEAAIKETKTGYLVSYMYQRTNRTTLNYVVRKSGLHMRIYAGNVKNYIDDIEKLPKELLSKIEKAGDCKRMLNPEACNSRCLMG